MQTMRPGGEMKSAAQAAPTRSQLLMSSAHWQELLTKSYFLPGLGMCLGVALMWAFLGERGATVPVTMQGRLTVGVPLFTIVVAAMITAGCAFAVYRMTGMRKAWWLMPVVGIAVGFATRSEIMWSLQRMLSFGFDDIEPGDGFVERYVKMFFLAGLPEELLKSIPVFFGVFVAVKLAQRLDARHPLRQFAVNQPLDGLLIGASAGLAFAFVETVLSYVPRTMLLDPEVRGGMIALLESAGIKLQLKGMSASKMVVHLHAILVAKLGPVRADAILADLLAQTQGRGLELMLPRLVGNLAGHVAYAGIFGYFIGLAALRPADGWKTVLIGLGFAAGVHALWNSIEHSLALVFLVKLFAFTAFAAAIAKARALSPDRALLAPSTVVDRPAPNPAGRPGLAPSPSVRPSVAPACAPSVASMTWGDPSVVRVIEVGGLRLDARPGVRLMETQLRGVRAAAVDGVVAQVTAHPSDPAILGLCNLGDRAWPMVMPDGTARELAPNRSVRLVRDLRIRIGDLDARIR